MRTAVLILLTLALAAPAGALALKRAPAGSLSVEGGRGTVKLQGRGGVLGRIARGTLQIVDTTPGDRWAPTVNGSTYRGRIVSIRGVNITFRLLGGQYRIVARGEGISISARGTGLAQFEGEPDLLGDTGVYAVGDNADCSSDRTLCEPIPDFFTRVPFGPSEQPQTTQPRQQAPVQVQEPARPSRSGTS